MTHLPCSFGRLKATVLVLMSAWALSACSTKQAAPETTFVLLDGSKTSTSALKGQVLLVNFWATSCISCVAEMPKLVATHQQFKARGYDTLAVAMSYDPPAYVADFAETRKLPFGVVIDNTGDIAKGFGDVKLTPTSFLINKRGQIRTKAVPRKASKVLSQLLL
jgi:peroxiredoxin